jgi:hypothetical protein
MIMNISYNSESSLYNLICKDECLFVCLFRTDTNPHFWTDLNQALHTSPPWSGGGRRVCMDPKFWTSSIFWVLSLWGHCRIMGTRWLPTRSFSAINLFPWFQLLFVWRHLHYVIADRGVIRGSLISVILAGVPLTSRKWSRSRRQSHPQQRRIPYYSGCSHHVTNITFNWATGASRHSVISLIPASVSVTYRKSHPCRRQLSVPTPIVRNA